ncbi:hypothetical protein QFC22_006482 [Naganishia vaughanmartiniae]|uniref:Uncharacterized protein n=1 Tax=Naganishia vaughanmartiniae TaxID=1424756 RepID=A0ACC2WLB5_9TREE|nr:hypothetical protein QFC22_006482 [Naganishia vaughanmartiniae]
MGNVLSSNYTYQSTTLDLGKNGKLQGKLVDGRVKRFTGVPYAKPPTGQYRWRKTRPLDAEHIYTSSEKQGEPLDCTRFGAQAWQTPMQFPGMGSTEGPTRYDEDCLTLNLWMPADDEERPEDGWPIMVWFHGESWVGSVKRGNLERGGV